MSQHMPPDGWDRPYEQGSSGEGRSGAGPADNPYFARQSAAQPPDLDANAPFLASSEERRLSRKALMFLGGIILVLSAAALLLFRSATADGDVERKPREEKVVIPELPRTVASAPVEEVPEQPEPVPLELSSVPPLPSDAQLQSMPPIPPEQHVSSLLERRILAGDSGDSGAQYGPRQGPPGQPGSPAFAEATEALAAQTISNPDTLLVEGTYIRCVLAMRIVTDVPGFTACVVTEPVYSINGRRLLLPKGSKILGRYETDATGPRVAVVWDRITTPNGLDINMANPGVDALGGAGHPGHYNAHWGTRIASALMISLIADAFKWAAAEHGPETTSVTTGGVVVQSPYESATARAMERVASDAIERSARRPATVTINQGTVLNVYVAQDVDFSRVLAGR